jgi:hypothetical protein
MSGNGDDLMGRKPAEIEAVEGRKGKEEQRLTQNLHNVGHGFFIVFGLDGDNQGADMHEVISIMMLWWERFQTVVYGELDVRRRIGRELCSGNVEAVKIPRSIRRILFRHLDGDVLQPYPAIATGGRRKLFSVFRT